MDCLKENYQFPLISSLKLEVWDLAAKARQILYLVINSLPYCNPRSAFVI